MSEAMDVHQLSSGWEFKQTDTEEWMKAARVPTNVHLDLIANDKYVHLLTSSSGSEKLG